MRLLALALFLPSVAFAQTFNLSWDTYPTGHKIQAYCMADGEEYHVVGETEANRLQVAKELAPGQTLKCKVRALRLADNQFSSFTPEVVYTRPLGPVVTPSGLRIEEVP